MDEKKIISDVSAEQITGCDGRNPELCCRQCGSRNLQFLGKEAIEKLHIVISHYQCRNCGYKW